jgi:hypothetical protein
VFDGKQGMLRTRIALPIQLSANYDALVADGKDNVLLGIAGLKGDGGVAVIDLSSLPLPAPVPFESQEQLLPKMSSPVLAKNTAKTSLSTANPLAHPQRRYKRIVNDVQQGGGLRVIGEPSVGKASQQ